MMHQIELDPDIVERVKQRRGKLHAYESLENLWEKGWRIA